MKLPELLPGEVQLWHTQIDVSNHNLPYYRSLLAPDELERLERFKFEKDRKCFCIARAMLRLFLGGYLQRDSKEVHFTYGSHGKPSLNIDSRIHFNLSHSGNGILIGFMLDYEIGVDIELVKHDFDPLEIAENYFSAIEILELKQAEPNARMRTFFNGWTRKEAFIKAVGDGLSFPLKSFAVSMSDKHTELLETTWNSNEKTEWTLFSDTINSDYVIAATVRNPKAKYRLNFWDGTV